MFGKLSAAFDSVVDKAKNLLPFGGNKPKGIEAMTFMPPEVGVKGDIHQRVRGRLDEVMLEMPMKAQSNPYLAVFNRFDKDETPDVLVEDTMTNVPLKVIQGGRMNNIRLPDPATINAKKAYGMFGLSLETASFVPAETARPAFNAGIHGDRMHWGANDDIESPDTNVRSLRKMPSPQEVRDISPPMRHGESFVRESNWAHRMRFAVAAAVLAAIGGMSQVKFVDAAPKRNYDVNDIVSLTNEQAAEIAAGRATREDFRSGGSRKMGQTVAQADQVDRVAQN